MTTTKHTKNTKCQYGTVQTAFVFLCSKHERFLVWDTYSNEGAPRFVPVNDNTLHVLQVDYNRACCPENRIDEWMENTAKQDLDLWLTKEADADCAGHYVVLT